MRLVGAGDASEGIVKRLEVELKRWRFEVIGGVGERLVGLVGIQSRRLVEVADSIEMGGE